MKSSIIGCGGIAQVHAKSIGKLSNTRLTAAADIRQDRAEAMAQEYGAKAYTDWEEMLEREEIDVLHICTPHYLHTPMAAAALKRGISVFMEKPPVTGWEQWETLKRAEKEAANGAKLGICFQNRFNPSVTYVKDCLEKGEFGEIKGARGIVTWCRKEPYYTESGWRGKKETEGGGALINQSIHTMDLIQYLIGKKPVSIEAVTANHHLKGVIEVEDMMEAYISYGKESACFYATTGYVTDVPPIIELECEKARVRIEDPKVTVFREGGQVEITEGADLECLGKSYWGSGHLHCIRSFYESLETGIPFPIGLEQIEDTIWLMLNAYDSASGGKKVR
ncbi:MAG: Gfo/Idh/MocA family oxidoreductase [Clostridiales bacterium]|nr:Gfo/Idh/MocA family oxidoreductase [Clostridiales bacterium]